MAVNWVEGKIKVLFEKWEKWQENFINALMLIIDNQI